VAKEADLFRAAMADVTPLKGGKSARAAAKPQAESLSKPREGLHAGRATTSSPAATLDSFDRDIDRALGRGKLAPEAKLDLHGMTVAAAERAVARFLEQAVDQDLRVVLIVTGKGWRREDGRLIEGRIRSEFPEWLGRTENRSRVRGLKPAHPRHGGSGAFYVLLRRRSSANRRSLRATPQR
jgi:DNA-nicking Smr family endonuclease